MARPRRMKRGVSAADTAVGKRGTGHDIIHSSPRRVIGTPPRAVPCAVNTTRIFYDRGRNSYLPSLLPSHLIPFNRAPPPPPVMRVLAQRFSQPFDTQLAICAHEGRFVAAGRAPWH